MLVMLKLILPAAVLFGHSQGQTLRVFGISDTSSTKGKAAFDLLKKMAADPNLVMEFVMEEDSSKYASLITDKVDAAKCNASCAHVLVPPYGSSKSKTFIESVPENSTIPILVWGGAADSLFDTACKNRACFGTFTVGSKYFTKPLELLKEKAGVKLKVATIVGPNSFETSVINGAKAMMQADLASFDLVSEQVIANTGELEAKVQKVAEQSPDVVLIAAGIGTVENYLVKTRAVVKPKAIVMTNAWTKMANYASNDKQVVDGVIMPTQWVENGMEDLKYRVTDAAFKSELGGDATYHAASAWAAALVIDNARAKCGSDFGQMKSCIESLTAFDTLYGSVSFGNDGTINKDVYVQQGNMSNGTVSAEYIAKAVDLVYPLPTSSSNNNNNNHNHNHSHNDNSNNTKTSTESEANLGQRSATAFGTILFSVCTYQWLLHARQP